MVRSCAPENLEILRCAIAHRSSTLTRRPGMTTSSSFHRLDAIPVGLAVVEALKADILDHRVTELILVDLGHSETLLLEEIDQLGFVGLDLGSGLRRRFLRNVGEDLAVFFRELLPERAGNHRV